MDGLRPASLCHGSEQRLDITRYLILGSESATFPGAYYYIISTQPTKTPTISFHKLPRAGFDG